MDAEGGEWRIKTIEMRATQITLQPLEKADRQQFILDNQEAFRYGATEEFGMRDNHFEEDGEIISRETIERAIDEPNAETYRISATVRKSAESC